MIQQELNEQFLEACYYGKLKQVKYLLTSPELKEHANINAKNNNDWNALMFVCRDGHLEIVRYLLESPELKDHADIYQLNKKGLNALMITCKYENFDIVEYLLLEKHIEVDNKTMIWLEENHHHIVKMINARDLHNKLQDTMDDKPQVQRKKI